jgi:hypothetical protein
VLPPPPATVDAMPIRLRKFIGTVTLLVLVIVWALVAMALAQAPAIHDNTFASIAYYVIAGMGWVLPAMPLVRWMSRPAVRGQ